MRDALSLLDQCAGGGQRVDEQEILDTLGLAGNLETARLMGLIAAHDTAGALETLGRLYGNGKDVSSVLEELSSLARDLLLRKTAPQGGAALLTGGYDGNTMRSLGEQFTAPRLLQILKLLQSTLPELARSSSRRTDAELCLIRLCDERLDDSATGLAARVARLEELLAGGIPASAVTPAPPAAPVPQPAAPVQPAPAPTPAAPAAPPQTGGPQRGGHAPLGGGAAAPAPRAARRSPPTTCLPRPPAQPEAPPAPAAAAPACRPQSRRRGRGKLRLLARLRGRSGGEGAPPRSSPSSITRRKSPACGRTASSPCGWTASLPGAMLNKPTVTQPLAQAAAAFFGAAEARVSVVVGQPPAEEGSAPPAAGERHDALDDLLAFGAQFDNIKIQ